MRFVFAIAGGFLAGIFCLSLFQALTRPRPMPAEAPAPSPRETEEVERLRAHVEELAAELRAARSEAIPSPGAEAGGGEGEAAPPEAGPEDETPGAPAESLTAEGLSRLLREKRHDALAEALEKLLLLGDAGHEQILAFLRQLAGLQNQPLWMDKALQFAILAAAFRNQEGAAEFARFFLRHQDPSADAMLREHVLRFLPSLVAFGGERFSGLREELEATLLDEVAKGNRLGGLWRTLQTMQDLGFRPPIGALESVLGDPSRRNDHFAAIQHLSLRDDDASVDLLRYVASQENPADPAYQQALHALGRMSHPSAQRGLAQYLDSPVREVRTQAALAYFGRPRDADSAPIALGFLNSDAGAAEKQALLWRLSSMSPQVFEAVREAAASTGSPEVKELIEKHAQATSSRKGGVLWTPSLGGPGGNVQVRVQSLEKE